MGFERKKLASIPEKLQEKWPGRMLDEGFTPFPKRLIRCLDQIFVGSEGINDLRVILSVVDFARWQQSRLPSVDYLAFIAGMDSTEFKTRLIAMEERGWLTVDGPDRGITVNIEGLVRLTEQLTDESEIDDDDTM